MLDGCYTAIVTPTKGDRGSEVDYDALHQLVDFQVQAGVSGILAMGTTGESPTLDMTEHGLVIERVHGFCADRCDVIAGTGSNCTAECYKITRHAAECGLGKALLVEPYYNGPSSLEIRREYMEPVARAFPDMQFIPYVIPGRSGTQLLPEDLALLRDDCPNIVAVKEASGSLQNMRRTREVCGGEFRILSGDDPLTAEMMKDETIGACGTVSVVSNVAPAAVQKMVTAYLGGRTEEGDRLAATLEPLCGIVTVKTQEESPYGPRACKARNPLPIKTLMAVLGMPVGPPRQPLGRMTRAGMAVLMEAALGVWKNNPEVLSPIEEAFGVDIEERLGEPEYRRALIYD